MHRISFAVLGAVLVAGPVLAQPAPTTPATPSGPSQAPAAHHRAHPRAHRPVARANPNQPVDVGPYTPDANRAYNGGGVVLQGAPGGPAPSPRTPLPPQN